eukprot:g28972.t1
MPALPSANLPGLQPVQPSLFLPSVAPVPAQVPAPVRLVPAPASPESSEDEGAEDYGDSGIEEDTDGDHEEDQSTSSEDDEPEAARPNRANRRKVAQRNAKPSVVPGRRRKGDAAPKVVKLATPAKVDCKVHHKWLVTCRRCKQLIMKVDNHRICHKDETGKSIFWYRALRGRWQPTEEGGLYGGGGRGGPNRSKKQGIGCQHRLPSDWDVKLSRHRRKERRILKGKLLKKHWKFHNVEECDGNAPEMRFASQVRLERIITFRGEEVNKDDEADEDEDNLPLVRLQDEPREQDEDDLPIAAVELEYSLLKLNPNKTVQLSLRGPEVMDRLRGQEQEPGAWGGAMSLVGVEQNMRLRRGRLLSALHADEVAPTLVAFPLMGVGPSFAATSTDSRSIAESSSVPDEVINPHPRFGTLTANIRQRRGSKVDIRMPLFQDLRTPEFESTEHPTIDMDCMAYGMGYPRMAGHGVRRQSKSRYDSISCYIHPSSQAYNDIPCEIDEEIRALLEDEGVDQALAQHIAHLFTRDPLVAFEGLIEADDEKSTDHFESVQQHGSRIVEMSDMSEVL